MVVCFKILIRENLFYRKKDNSDQNTPSNSPRARWHHIKIRERQGPSRGIVQKCAPHERNPCAPRFEERTQDETLQQQRCARRVASDLAKSVCKLKITDKHMLNLFLKPGQCRRPFQTFQRNENSWLTRSINAFAEQKGFELRRLETLRRSRTPLTATVITTLISW